MGFREEPKFLGFKRFSVTLDNPNIPLSTHIVLHNTFSFQPSIRSSESGELTRSVQLCPSSVCKVIGRDYLLFITLVVLRGERGAHLNFSFSFLWDATGRHKRKSNQDRKEFIML